MVASTTGDVSRSIEEEGIFSCLLRMGMIAQHIIDVSGYCTAACGGLWCVRSDMIKVVGSFPNV